ncbi:hypothetical protein [Streptomyces lunaelactis]|uniref:hypothetical protein n=1 Tax=Streptomyces lunaelactis TaxID=1535768 RepID=UPI0015850147|nr:hypothetical protein [Streptomyces lunaelactis]NUK25593.1 hypothetical protein [Streptomyces lunaelactis]
MAVAHLATERWMADEQADFVREFLSAGAAEFPAVAAGAFAASGASQAVTAVSANPVHPGQWYPRRLTSLRRDMVHGT